MMKEIQPSYCIGDGTLWKGEKECGEKSEKERMKQKENNEPLRRQQRLK